MSASPAYRCSHSICCLQTQEQVKLQLTREPRALPQMIINPEVKDLFSFQYEDFSLQNYDPHPHIAGVVAV